MKILKDYGYAWVTLAFFIISLAGHWFFGWFAYIDEQRGMGAAITTAGYLNEMLRDTFENWQSEFLQLIWQVGGLAILLHVGSPQSKEGDDRMEAKLDMILLKVDPEADDHIRRIDEKYEGRASDPYYKGLMKSMR